MTVLGQHCLQTLLFHCLLVLKGCTSRPPVTTVADYYQLLHVSPKGTSRRCLSWTLLSSCTNADGLHAMVDFLFFISVDFPWTMFASLRYLVSRACRLDFTIVVDLHIFTFCRVCTVCSSATKRQVSLHADLGSLLTCPPIFFIRLLSECCLLHLWSRPCLQTWVGFFSYFLLISIFHIFTRYGGMYSDDSIKRHQFGRLQCLIGTWVLFIECRFSVSIISKASSRLQSKKRSQSCLHSQKLWLVFCVCTV